MAWKGAVVASFETDAIRLRVGSERPSSVALTFDGAVNTDAQIIGEDRRSGYYNFFLGNDSTRWRSNVPAYGGVVYRDLYDGVDVRVREETGRLEYDVMLEPGADLEQVVIRADGASNLELGSDGSLTLRTPTGSVRQTPPRTWDVLPSGEARPVASRFRIIDAQRYGFEAPARDLDLALVIDPGLEWSTFLGGGNREEVHGLALAQDGTGDVVVAGSTWSSDFPTAPPGALGSSPLIAFVARLNSTGTNLVYATLFGGTNGNVSFGFGLTLDATSAPIVVGETNAANFPTTPGTFQPSFNEPTATINRGWDGFVTRFNASGTQMVFSTFLGAAPIFDPSRPGSQRGGDESARAVVVDATDSVVVSGYTTSEDFPTTPGAYDRTLATLTVPVQGGTIESRADAFVARLSPGGTQLTYSTYLGGQSDDLVKDMVIDPQGVLTLVGTEAPLETFDTQNNRTDHGIPFPTTADAVVRTHLGASDVFVARLKLDGTGAGDLKYGTIFGGFYIDEATGIALDPNNPELITICGNNRSWDFPTTSGAWRRAPLFLADGHPYYSGYLTRFRFPATGGGSLVWSTLLTGTATGQFADSVVVDPSGDVIVVGQDIAGAYPTTERSYKRLPAKGSFVSRFSGDGRALLYSTLLHKPSGALLLRMQSVSTGPHAVVVAGSTLHPDHPTTPGAFDRVFGSDGTSDGFHTYDGFVAKLTLDQGTSTDTAAAAPTLLSPANGVTIPLNAPLTLDWADVADASGVQLYEVEVSANADFLTGFTFFSLAAGSFTSSEATGSTSQEGVHYWRVRTLDGVNNFSPWSEVRRFTVGAPTWTNFAAASLTPNGVVGGSTVVGKVHIQNVAPAGGQVYTLTSSNPAVASVSASVTVPAGASSATFTVTTHPVSVSTPVQITVWSEGNGEHPVLWVDPAAPGTVTLSALSLNPTSVTGGNASTGTATLSAAAAAGGQLVSLSSGNTAVATVPSSVTVPAGSSSATFAVSTVAVGASTNVTISGTSGGTTRTATLTVSPAGGGAPGFRSPTASAADSGGDGNGFESNAANAHADDAAAAVDNNGGTSSSTSCTSASRDKHRFFNYGFSIPTGTGIPGIEVRLDARADSSSNSPRMCVQLSWNGGASWTAAKSTSTLTTSMTTYVLGSPTDTWGRTWTPAELSDANFRVRVINSANSTNRDFFLDWVAVRVNQSGPPAPDTTPPTVSITSPTNGATVSGTVTISSTASDNVGVARVEFLVDGAVLSSDTTSPYSASWNTTTATNGAHALTARAFDAASNQATSAAVAVAVSNAVPDTTPPTVSITSPSNGATVSGTVTISATASDNVGVARVEFLVDGVVLSSDTTSPYTASWSTTTATNGSHALTARAFDAASNQATSAAVGVTVSNAAPDTTPPTVSITSPTNGATVSGTVTISSTASDNVGVARVEFLVDGAVLSSDTTSPYSASWNTTTATNGAHALTARAFDAASNQATSAAVNVTVNNGSPPVLDITMSGVPTTIRRGQFFTATGSVANTGGASASGHTVLVSFTPSNSMRLESPQSSTQSLPTVAPGGSQNVSWLIRADNTATATLTMTLRNASGQTVDTVSRTFTITD